ncbi:MAG: hypothetical protein KatS3mg078_0874 [Deltaproteobacteria bacterium]|nr:MAG: hypothetical protein KatS3mg078_0874 [Deltaproteobacteria bacterium]
MSQCPICKKKYDKEVEYCPGCQVGNIPESTFERELRRATFVEVFRTEDVGLAGLIKEVLEDHDILCYLDNYFSHSLSLHLFSPIAYQGIRVMVYSEEIKEARDILSLFFSN